MDLFLNFLDTTFLDSVYESIRYRIELTTCPTQSDSAFHKSIILRTLGEILCDIAKNDSIWDRASIFRQSLSLFLSVCPLSVLLYIPIATFCYYWVFDRSLEQHPKFARNQIKREISDSLHALLYMNIMTTPILIAQINSNGYCKLYKFGTANWWYEFAQIPLFIVFSDTCVYWLHRLFHRNSFLFKTMHKKHHKYVVPTPFGAYTFHPIEGWIMSLPVYAYSFILPMSDYVQLAVLVYSNLWTFILHDSREQAHTVHHKNMNFNFGQFCSLWDRLGGTYVDPGIFLKAENARNPLIGSKDLL